MARMYTCVCVCLCVFVFVRVCVSLCACPCLLAYGDTYGRIYTHTDTHEHKTYMHAHDQVESRPSELENMLHKQLHINAHEHTYTHAHAAHTHTHRFLVCQSCTLHNENIRLSACQRPSGHRNSNAETVKRLYACKRH